jgi:VanZ family protein
MTNYFKLLFFSCLGVIEYLATTTQEIEMISSMWDKSNHFLAFFTLYILITLAYQKMKMYVRVLWLMVFAIEIEIVQHFIEGNLFSLLDVVADAIGILIGIFVFRLYKKYFKKS